MASREHTIQSPSAESSNTQQEVEEAAVILLNLKDQEEAAATLLSLRRFDESPLPQDQVRQAGEAR